MAKEKLVPWRCDACGAILGYVDPKSEVLRIKLRDIYQWFRGGTLAMTCRKCGQLNELTQKGLSTTEDLGVLKKEKSNGV